VVSKKEFTNVDLPMDRVIGAYVQFREMNYFKNARFRQCQEQRRVKAHGRQANLDFLKKFARLELKLQAIICRP